MDEPAKWVFPQFLKKVGNSDTHLQPPCLAWVSQRNRLATLRRSRFQQRTKVRITADYSIQGDHIHLRKFIHHISEIGMDEFDAFTMTLPLRFFIGNLQISRRCIHMHGFTRHIFQQLVVDSTNSAADIQQGYVLQPQRPHRFENQFGLFRRSALTIIFEIRLGFIFAKGVIFHFTAIAWHENSFPFQLWWFRYDTRYRSYLLNHQVPLQFSHKNPATQDLSTHLYCSPPDR